VAQIKTETLSTQHLLCVMEEWFDASVPLIKTLAKFDYARARDDQVYCPCCGFYANSPGSLFILAGQLTLQHAENCPVLLARSLYDEMILTDNAVDEYAIEADDSWGEYALAEEDDE
jgi:hypothetical protein